MDRETVIGLSAAGVRRRSSGGDANRSQRAQRRAREKALAALEQEFFKKAGISLRSIEASAHPYFPNHMRRAELIINQVLVP